MKNVVETKLSNNLPLYSLDSKKAPVVTLQVWVRTGSADELKNEAGLSHFIEHLVFKGTKNYQAGEIAQKVESVGGQLNAYTSFDQTVFYVTVPSQYFHVAADVLSDMVGRPLFDPKEVDNEREVVIEEIKMGQDQPSRVASRMLFRQMFKGHPYEFPVIGTQENIERVGLEEIKSYFNERYVASNMALVCVGDLPANYNKIMEEKFSLVSQEPKETKRRERQKRSLSESYFSNERANFEKNYFYISWPVEGFVDLKSENYELLSMLLGQGESSHLYKDLKLKKGLCRSIGASYFGNKESGIFVINGVAVEDETAALLEEIPKSLKSFLNKKSISKDIVKAKNILQSEESYAEESISSLCRYLGEDWLYYGRLGEHEERKNRVLSHNESHIQEGLKSLFAQKPYLSLLSKNDFSREGEKLLEDLKSLHPDTNFVKGKTKVEKLNSLQSSPEKEYLTWTTVRGSKVLFVSQPLGSVVSFKIGFEGGDLLTKEKQQGLTSLYEHLWGREFKGMNENQVNALFDFYCSSFSSFAGRHSSGLSLTTLNNHFSELSDFMVKSIVESEFSESTLRREKENLIQKLNYRKDHPASLAFKYFSELIFKESFYERDSLGRKEDIQTLDQSDFFDFQKKSLEQNAVYSVVGNLEKEEVEKAINEIDTSLPSPVAKGLYNKFSEIKYGEGEERNYPSEKKQSHIILGYPGLTYKDPQKLEVDLLMAILGGQGGRLFIELRDKKSLAYSVAPLDFSGLYGGYLGAYIACDPSKKEMAIKMMREELHKLAGNKVSEAEFQWMKNQILGRYAMGSQRNSYICDLSLFDKLYGLPSFDFLRLAERLETISREDLRKTAEMIFSGPEFRICVG